jgi:hypothetical protein
VGCDYSPTLSHTQLHPTHHPNEIDGNEELQADCHTEPTP